MNGTGIEQVAVVPDFWLMMLKSIGMLCVVLAALVCLLMVIRRLSSIRSGGEDKKLIRHLASFHISPKERLMLMDVKGKQVLLGVSQTAINTLVTFDDDDATETASEKVPDNLFKGFFNRAYRKQIAEEESAAVQGTGTDQP